MVHSVFVEGFEFFRAERAWW